MGTIFQIFPDGSHYKTLASFNGEGNGAYPYDNVVVSADGRTLYGMTQAGGVYDPTLSNNYGTIFAFHPPLSDVQEETTQRVVNSVEQIAQKETVKQDLGR
jgi:hypothetical protein